MKAFYLLPITTALLTASVMANQPQSSSENAKYVYGFGLGNLNTGVGFGVGQVFESSMLYGSLGCFDWSSNRGGPVCGVTTSYLQAMPWGNPNRHALHLGYGFIKERKGLGIDDEYRKHDTWVSKPTVGYLYFFDGIGAESGHIGLNISPSMISLDWGFQWAD